MNTICIHPSCNRPQYENKYCKIHNNRLKKYNTVDCIIEGCNSKYRTRGLCKSHSEKYYKHGDPNKGYGQPTPVRFWSHVNKTDTCWNWIGTITNKRKPYGLFRLNQKLHTVAHRYSYELAYGKIPDGHQIDHLCGNHRCVNPSHLIASTPSEHQRRHSYLKPTCKRGHPWTPENTHIQKFGWRLCKTCSKMSKKEKEQFDKAASKIP